MYSVDLYKKSKCWKWYF